MTLKNVYIFKKFTISFFTSMGTWIIFVVRLFIDRLVNVAETFTDIFKKLYFKTKRALLNV